MRRCKPGVWKTRQNKWKMKGGAAMARRPVTVRRGTNFGGSRDIIKTKISLVGGAFLCGFFGRSLRLVMCLLILI
jgi:hypothetical protein